MSTTNEIISRVENRLARYLIDTTKCLEGCKCVVCFHKYLDSVLSASDAVTVQEPVFDGFIG